VRRRPLLTLRDTSYCFRLPDLTTFGPHFLIDALIAGNHTRFINHSHDPNVEACSVFCDGLIQMILRTIRPVAPGEELLMDYGPLYWRRRRRSGRKKSS
jgi:SET domain-containing protein